VYFIKSDGQLQERRRALVFGTMTLDKKFIRKQKQKRQENTNKVIQ
jgi:hypothetical protein